MCHFVQYKPDGFSSSPVSWYTGKGLPCILSIVTSSLNPSPSNWITVSSNGLSMTESRSSADNRLVSVGVNSTEKRRVSPMATFNAVNTGLLEVHCNIG